MVPIQFPIRLRRWLLVKSQVIAGLLTGLGLLLTLPSPPMSSLAWSQDVAEPVEVASLQLTIPPRIDAVAGQPLAIFVDNVILTQSPQDFLLEVDIERDGTFHSVGKREADRWTFRPEPADAGVHRIRVRLMDAKTNPPREITVRSSKLVVGPADAGRDSKISLLIVGDSLTHATLYPNSLATLLSQPGNPTWKMLGTHRPGGAAAGVSHEGYGGWTWERFVTHYVPDSEGKEPKLRGSPFVFAEVGRRPELNPARYFDTHFGGERPDVIVFLLGINDCFSAPPDNPTGIDERIDVVFRHAATLLAAMRKAAPNSALVICATPPPNSRQKAFEANYQDRYTRWGWKRIQHRLVQRQIQQFGHREKENLLLIPTELNVDPEDGYPDNNGVHPNATGYQQIAATIYSWLKCRRIETP